jgi:hypothetical protein
MSKIKQRLREEQSVYRLLDTYTVYAPLTGDKAIAGQLINSNGEVHEVLINYADMLEAIDLRKSVKQGVNQGAWRSMFDNWMTYESSAKDSESTSADDNPYYDDPIEKQVYESAEDIDVSTPAEPSIVSLIEGEQDGDYEPSNAGDDFDSGKTTEVPVLQPSQTGSISSEYVQKLQQSRNAEGNNGNMADKIEHAHDNVMAPEFNELGTIVDVDDVETIAEISRLNSMTPEERKIANKQSLETMQNEGHEEQFSAVAEMQSQSQDESTQAQGTDSEVDDDAGEGFY